MQVEVTGLDHSGSNGMCLQVAVSLCFHSCRCVKLLPDTFMKKLSAEVNYMFEFVSKFCWSSGV